MTVLHELVAMRGVALLDAGLATSLAARGHDLSDPLWSARLLLDAPDEIVQVHRADLEAGADIVTTASYQASVPGLVARGLEPHAALDVVKSSVVLARRAVDGAVRPDGSRPLVAGSVGSYGAYLADGSEYRGDYGVHDDALARFHRARLHALAEHADVLACETIPCVQEARVLASILAEREGPPAWVSFSARGDAHTAAGEPIEAAALALADAPRVVAIGVNCVAPAQVEPLVRRLHAATDRLVVAYPNSGERWQAGDAGGWCGPAITPAELAGLAERWAAAGATIIGGCCRTSAAHVAALARWRDERATGPRGA